MQKIVRPLFAAIFALGLLTLQQDGAGAAAIRKVTPDESLDCSFRIEGEFKPGDDAAIIPELRAAQSGGVICLDSNGGNLDAALNIAEFLVGEGMRGSRSYITMVRKGDTCLSACAVLFMSGNIEEEGVYPLRRIEAGGRVCFHQPFAVMDGTRSYSASDLDLFMRVVVGELNRIVKLSNRFYQAHLANWQDQYSAFPSALVKDMLSTPPGDLLCIENIAQFARYRIEPAVSFQGQITDIVVPTIGVPREAGELSERAVNACRNYLSAFFPENFYDTSLTRYGRQVTSAELRGSTVYAVGNFNFSGASYEGFPCYVRDVNTGLSPAAWLAVEDEGDRRQWYERFDDAVNLPNWYIFPPEQVVAELSAQAPRVRITQPERESSPTYREGEWLVIMASTKSMAEVEARSAAAMAAVPGARIVRTEEFNNLRPGLFALVSGPWAKSDAERLVESARRALPDAYVKKAYRQ